MYVPTYLISFIQYNSLEIFVKLLIESKNCRNWLGSRTLLIFLEKRFAVSVTRVRLRSKFRTFPLRNLVQISSLERQHCWGGRRSGYTGAEGRGGGKLGSRALGSDITLLHTPNIDFSHHFDNEILFLNVSENDSNVFLL